MNGHSSQEDEERRINLGPPSANGHPSASQPGGTSAVSSSSTATVIPPKVEDVCVTSNVPDSSSILTITWDAIARPDVTYTVTYSTEAGKVDEPPEGALKVEGITGTSTDLTELEQGTNYYIWVVGFSNGVLGPHSDRMSETTTAVVPKVNNVCVTPNVQELSPTLKVAWHPNATPGVTYTVKYSTQAGKVNEPPEGASKVEGIMGTSTTLTELEQDKNYYIWVVAVSDDVEGPHSDRMTGTTLPQVKNVCVNVQDSSPTLKVDWQAIARPNVSYTVKYSNEEGDMNTPPVDVKDVVVTGTSTKLTGLQRGTTYYIWVAAVSNGVEGPHSERIKATTLPKLKFSDFMPFESDSKRTHKKISTQRITGQSLRAFLRKDFDTQQDWMDEAKQLLCSPGSASQEVEIEDIALCLKKAVWEEFKVEDLPEEEQGLFWVLNSTQTPTPRRKAEPVALNLFSFRALFGAVLHDGGKDEGEKENEQRLFPIHIAAQNLLPDAVSYLLSWGIDVNLRSYSANRTALHYAVRFSQHEDKQKQQRTLVQILQAFKACHNMEDTSGHVPLFNAILTQDIDLVELLIDFTDIDHADVEGDTHLHIAAELSLDEIACLLIDNGADPGQRNDLGQTPSHIAAQKSDTCLIEMSKVANSNEVDIVDTFSQEDTSGNTPLDYAAMHSHKKTFRYMWKQIQETTRPDLASYKPVLDRLFYEDPKETRFTTLQETLKQYSKPEIQELLTVKDLAAPNKKRASLHRLLKSEADDCTPVVTSILDNCLYGKKVVISKVLDSDEDGRYSPKSNHDAVLRKLVSSHYRFWGHRTMKIWINGKWDQFGKYIVCCIALLYFLQMLALTTALCLAIRPGMTDETLNYYNTPLDQFRAFVEAVVILTWMVKIGNELYKFIVLRPKIYFRDLFVYINSFAIILLGFTIPLRIVQFNIQWLFAALAYLMYSMLALEYFSLLKWSGAYIQTLFIIVKQDILKFLAVFLVLLMGFAGAFLLVLQVDRANHSIIQEAGGMTSASDGDGADNSTVFIWNTFYLGLRLMVEADNILEYNGRLGWLAVIFYLSFLMVTAIIMLNVLIAQMSDTYNKVRDNARAFATFHRARFLLRYLGLSGCLPLKRAKEDCYNCIIWSPKVMKGTKDDDDDEDQRGIEVSRHVKDFAKNLFLEDVIAKEESAELKQETMKQEMMKELKATVKDSLKKLRKDIAEDLQAEIAKMQKTTTTGSSV